MDTNDKSQVVTTKNTKHTKYTKNRGSGMF